MVYASHVIFGAYGFWLPNDPRGSWSEFVGAWELFRYGGGATKTTARRSVAAAPHNRQARLATKEKLKYPAVRFTGLQAQSVGHGFLQFAERAGLTIWACAIMPDHVHLVVARHRYEVEKAVILLKGAARVLEEQNIHPMARFPRKRGRLPKCWARGEWKVFLENEEDIARAIAYVENNPIKEGLPPQRWLCVTPFSGLGARNIAQFSRDSKRSAR